MAFWLTLYNLVLVLLSPYFLLSKLVSWSRKGPLKNYDWKRWWGGAYSCELKRPGVIRLVYMCASYGEAVLAEALHQKLEEKGLPVEAVYTIRNRQELERFRTNTGHCVLIYPFDFWLSFNAWHRKAQPDIVVFVEKFFFGNVAIGSKKRGAQVVAINARANVRRKPIRKLISFHYPAIVRSFDWIGARTAEHAERIQEMAPGASPVENVGNFKSGMPIKPLAEDQLAALRRWVEEARYPNSLFVAGSLDSDEEFDFVLEAFRLLREKVEASLLIAPRQLSDSQRVFDKADSLRLVSSLRSAPTPEADVLVLDTLGELAQAYQFGIGAFIGGTITGAGHNIIEPLHWGIPVAYGPVRGHFQDLQLLCEAHGIGFRLSKPTELFHHWLRLAEDGSFRQELRSAIEPVLSAERRGFLSTVSKVSEIVESLAASRNSAMERKREADAAVNRG